MKNCCRKVKSVFLFDPFKDIGLGTIMVLREDELEQKSLAGQFNDGSQCLKHYWVLKSLGEFVDGF